jgi:hypothetical protein
MRHQFCRIPIPNIATAVDHQRKSIWMRSPLGLPNMKIAILIAPLRGYNGMPIVLRNFHQLSIVS